MFLKKHLHSAKIFIELLCLANWAYNLLAAMQSKISVFGWLWGNICRTKNFCWNSTSLSTQSYWLVYVCCFEIAGLIKGPDRKTLETDITNGLVCRNSYFHGTVLFFSQYTYNNHNMGHTVRWNHLWRSICLKLWMLLNLHVMFLDKFLSNFTVTVQN